METIAKLVTEGRQERHLMRQRGAGAREITASFGFVFRAGPVQLEKPPASLETQPKQPSQEQGSSKSTQSPTHKQKDDDDCIALSEKIEDARDRANREKKKAVGEEKEERPPLEVDLRESEPDLQAQEHLNNERPEEIPTNPAAGVKRKPARKAPVKRPVRSKIRPRKHTEEESQAQATIPKSQPDEKPIQPRSPEWVPKRKAAARRKPAVTASKHPDSAAKDAELPQDEDELSNDSLTPLISRPVQRTGNIAQVITNDKFRQSPKRKARAMSRKKDRLEERIEPSAQEMEHEPKPPPQKRKRTVKEEFSPDLLREADRREAGNVREASSSNEKEPENLHGSGSFEEKIIDPPTRRGGKRKEVKNRVEDGEGVIENPIYTGRSTKRLVGTDKKIAEYEEPPQTQENPEPGLAPKKRKVAREAAAAEAEDERAPRKRNKFAKTTSDQDIAVPAPEATSRPQRARKAKNMQEGGMPTSVGPQTEITDIRAAAIVSEAPKQKRTKLRAAALMPVGDTTKVCHQNEPAEGKSAPTRQQAAERPKRTRRQPLAERNSNSSSHKPTIDTEDQDVPAKQRKQSKSVAKKRTDTVEEAVAHGAVSTTPSPSSPTSLQLPKPDVSAKDKLIIRKGKPDTHEKVETESSMSQSRKRRIKKLDIPVHEDGPTNPKNATSKADSAVENHDLDLALFDMGMPAFAAQKAPKVQTRKFKDDDDLDLDQLLDGIAAIAGKKSTVGGNNEKQPVARARLRRGSKD